MRASPLINLHREAGAEIGEFAGWQSPLWFTTVREEHQAVRNEAGIFDISHMTRIEITGNDAETFLDKLLTQDVRKTKPGRMKYCLMLNEKAGIIDDLTFYKDSEKSIIIVSNAITRERVVGWLRKHSEGFDVDVHDFTDSSALLAVQGPSSAAYLGKWLNTDLRDMKWFSGRWLEHRGLRILLTRSGYTGEDGFELNIRDGSAEEFGRVWMEFMAMGVKPCGLAVRDMLRLECAYPLYGHEMDESTTPVEARLMWAVKMEKQDFVGKDVLISKTGEKPSSLLVGLKMVEQGIPREGYVVMSREEREIGRITSGGMSYSLNRGIALARIAPEYADDGAVVLVDIKGKPRQAEVSLKPFVEYRIPR